MLFTGKGDGGTSKTLRGEKERIAKSSAIFEALGTLDELNSFVGLVKVRAHSYVLVRDILGELQEALFVVQAEVAGAEKYISEETVMRVGNIVNAIEKELPPITKFTVSGGTELSALLDVARTIARRTERRIIAATETGVSVSASTRAFLNRLSSLLFALARLSNDRAGVVEVAPHY